MPAHKLPQALGRVARWERLGDDVPALVAHPNWERPAPAVVWMHGRTVNKELDPGRYLRWLRAGIGVVALDLPGHGERFREGAHSPHATLDTLAQMVDEIDSVVASLDVLGPFDVRRLAIGGMSLGGMCSLRRLCDPHPFVASAVECTTGNLSTLYFGAADDQAEHAARPWPASHDPAEVRPLDPAEHLGGFRPLPLLVLHNELDGIIPIGGQRDFVDRLRTRYEAAGASPDLIEWHAFGETGAPSEHAGFGRFANDAKNNQTEFLVRTLRPEPA